MRRWVALSGLTVVVVACAPGEAAVTTTLPAATTTFSRVATTSTLGSTTTTAPVPGGYLVRLDMETLQPVDDVEPIPIEANSSNFLSRDGSVLVNLECDGVAVLCHRATGIDVDTWRSWGPIDVGSNVERTAEGSTYYGYDDRGGSTGRGLFSVDLVIGEEVHLAEWRDSLYFWDGLHVLPGGLIAGLGAAPSDTVDYLTHYSVYVYDPDQGESVIPVGPLDRSEWNSGVFDGEYEIPIFDSPGVAWGDDRLFIANAEDLEVTEVDLTTGAVETHQLDASSWLDRLLAFWMPSASAKGPSMGTYSSAALSPDGKYLFVSGNRMDVETQADGSVVEVQEHLGLRVIDTETWRMLSSPDLNIQFVRNAGDLVLGVETTSTEEWTEEYYVFDVNESGDVLVSGPFALKDGWCDATAETSRLVCWGRAKAQLYDLQTTSTIAEVPWGSGDIMHGIGVLEDWEPSYLP